MRYLCTRMPALSYLCNRYHTQQHALCASCNDLIEPLGPACEYCATPLPDIKPMICGACCIKRLAVDRVITHYRFAEPLRTLIHAFKYDAALYLRSWLTQLLLDAKPEGYTTECLIPVPLHPTKLRQRGFNQAALLTQTLSHHLKLPHALDGCRKIAVTLPQAGLSAAQRQTNLNRSFQAQPLPYQHITLIDDVYTTGATANSIALLLKKQGLKRIDVWCCARTC